MCKLLLWSVKHILNKSISSFDQISNSIKILFVGRAPWVTTAEAQEISRWNEKNKIDGLVQEKRNSIANALELRLSYTNPSKWWCVAIHTNVVNEVCKIYR